MLHISREFACRSFDILRFESSPYGCPICTNRERERDCCGALQESALPLLLRCSSFNIPNFLT